MSKENFSERLAELRNHNDLTQETLGKLLNVSANTITQWEHGKSFPKHRCTTIIKISRMFQVSIDYLLGNQDLVSENIPNRHDDLEFMSHSACLSPYTQKLYWQLITVMVNFQNTHESKKADD